MSIKNYGNWKFEKILGAGGFGQVELWKEKYTNKKIAIKRCTLPEDSITSEQKKRWKQEIENIENIKHLNIVKSEPIPPEIMTQSPVLCMEFCNKGDLRKVLSQPENSCGLLQNEVLSVMKDVSSALQYLHFKKITHRDLKPENIVLHEVDEIIIYKLIDLGFAKELGSKTTTASLVGTFNYFAPEIFWKKKYSCSVDYWSLGILYFEILTGYKPFIPYLENLNWVKFIKNKKYQEICAKEKVDGGIEFFDHIIYPNDFSEEILSKLIEWFRLVFQWDPSRRGKRTNSTEVIVFSMLENIIPQKSVFVFFVPFYKMKQFHVYNDTTLVDLKQWIEKSVSIPIHEQTIADTAGNLLNELKNYDKKPLKDILSSTTLYVYRKNSLEVVDDYSEIPKILDLMIVEPNAIKDRPHLRQCYTAVVYVLRHELILFKQYMFALSTKLDIVSSRLETLKKNVQSSLYKVEILVNEVQPRLISMKPEPTDFRIINSIKVIYEKIKNLHLKINQIKFEMENIESFILRMKKIFENDKLLCNLETFSKIYEDFLEKFVTFETKKTCTPDNIIEQINTLSEILDQFEKQKTLQVQDKEVLEIAREFGDFEKKLYSYLEVIKSAMELIPFYKNQFFELSNTINQSKLSHISCATEQIHIKTDDTEIRDNIVLRAFMDEYVQGMRQNLNKLTNLDFDNL